MQWSHSSFLIRSPLVRAAALVPTLGYVLLYGGVFSDLFDFTGALGEHAWTLSPSTKVRFLYYGGLMVLFALGLYLWRCPEICKRLHSYEQARDEFSRIGSPHDIHLILNRLEFRWRSHVFGHHEGLYPLARHLITHADLGERNNIVAAATGGGFIFKPITKQSAENAIAIFASAHLLEPQRDKDQAQALYLVGVLATQKLLERYFDNPQTKEFSQLFYADQYSVFDLSRQVSQRVVKYASILGVGLVAIPTLDVLLHVMVMDFTALWYE